MDENEKKDVVDNGDNLQIEQEHAPMDISGDRVPVTEMDLPDPNAPKEVVIKIGAQGENFDPETEQEGKLDSHLAEGDKDEKKDKKKKQKHRWLLFLPAAFLIFVAVLVVGWQLESKHVLNVCILDKTILTLTEENGLNKNTLYRKHQGLTWLLNQQKYVLEDGREYDYTSDYFGPVLDENGEIESERKLTDLDFAPDVMYISDEYGATNDSMGYYNGLVGLSDGLTSEDMSVVGYAYEAGATLIGEMELFNSCEDASVYNQASATFGVTPLSWQGRYFQELRDFSDVPDWAPPMYEQQEGVEWQFSGPGIILVSNSGKIIVLEQKTDFESKDLLQIYINDEYEEEFGSCGDSNFYNWFELVEANYGTEVIATFAFDVNATGMEKIKEVSKTPRFPAIIRKMNGDQPTYYFSGDFNDYVSQQNFNKFWLADGLFRSISYDTAGDITSFYWNFYSPLMKQILKETYVRRGSKVYSEDEQVDTSDTIELQCKIEDGAFYKLVNGNWEAFDLKAVSINGYEPGYTLLSSSYDYYHDLLHDAVDLGANTIYAKTLLPPEFYRALQRINKDYSDTPLFLIQGVTALSTYTNKDYNSEAGIEALLNGAVSTLCAVHGDGSVAESDIRDMAVYFVDVSPYTLGYVLDVELSVNQLRNLARTEAYTGNYYSAGAGATAYIAKVMEKLQGASKDTYDELVSIGVKTAPEVMAGCVWSTENTIDISAISCSDEVKSGFFQTIDLMLSSEAFNLAKANYSNRKEVKQFLNFISDVKNALTMNTIATGIGLSTEVGGYTEKEQGNGIVDMLEAVQKGGYMGAVIADLNDNWLSISEADYPFISPESNKRLWKNVMEPTENTGIISIEASQPKESGMELADDDRLQHLSVYSNECYIYLTAQLLDDIDYVNEEMFIGIDTYQRNDGEYFYAANYTSTSLSGMEFVIRFSNKRTAALYVTENYDKNAGTYSSKESYTAIYNKVIDLTYGSFSTGDGLFYQTGSNIFIRIPWAALNVTDPSQKVVINHPEALGSGAKAKTVQTNGFLFSFLISDKMSKDELYLFPNTKQDPGYKVYKWKNWEEVTYETRRKDSFDIIQNFFQTH